MCQSNLDSWQKEISNEAGKQYNIPVFYFTELMGVAFGLSPRSLGLHKHFRDPAPALRSHSLVT